MRCIAAGTPVLLADGTSEPIERVVERMSMPGARVELLSPRVTPNGVVTELASCTAAFDNGTKNCVELTLEDGRTLVCTPDHRVLTADGQWVEAARLDICKTRVAVAAADAPIDVMAYVHDRDAMAQPTMKRKVIARRDVGPRRVFDLSVPGNTAFFAGTVAVHNCIGATTLDEYRQYIEKDVSFYIFCLF